MANAQTHLIVFANEKGGTGKSTTAVNLALALTAMRAWTFAWVSMLGMLPGTIVYVNAGTALGEWQDAFGIRGFDLVDPRLLLEVDAQQRVGFGVRAGLALGGRDMAVAAIADQQFGQRPALARRAQIGAVQPGVRARGGRFCFGGMAHRHGSSFHNSATENCTKARFWP